MKIAVIAEISDNAASKMTRELFTLANRLAVASDGQVSAIVLGSAFGRNSIDELTKLGAAEVYLLEHPLLGDFQVDLYAETFGNLFKTRYTPDVLLFGHNETARSLAPYLAAKLKAGACLECIDVCFDAAAGECYGVHPFYGGNVVGSFVPKNRPQIFTVRQGSYDPAAYGTPNGGKIIKVETELKTAAMTKVLDIMRHTGGGSLEEADVIVGGGRGIGGAEGFAMLAELADILGGVVGASRSAVDAGWIEAERQIGLTGKFVSPSLYIAIGISGTMQHMTGCSRAKTIVAINHDPQAPIFQYAHYGIAIDYKKVVPVMIRFAQNIK